MNDSLSIAHLDMLHASAISDEVIQARGYRTIRSDIELTELGFAPVQCRVPGLLLPLWTTDGSNGVNVYRPDNPRVFENKRKGRNPDGTYPCKTIKYEFPKGAGIRLDCPPHCLVMIGDPNIPLWVTEGQKKADSLASGGLCAIALLGVWNFKGRNERGGTTLLADWDYVALKGREVRVVFDSDLMKKREIQQALNRLTEHLQRKGAKVSSIYLPAGPNSEKLGVDDWLALGHTIQELEDLIEAPRPTPQPAPALVELLDAAPLKMTRPLALINGAAYAAAWLPVKVTVQESRDKKGGIVRHDPPIVTGENRLFIVRQDGIIFGDGGDLPMSKFEIDVHLPEVPPVDKTWSVAGVKSYKAGNHPDPGEVFQRLVGLIDRFIDFDRSLGDQGTMSEAVACYILATYLLDSFQVIGFLWPNGDRGSGKTHLLIVICELAYLGQLILSGGSFASLRDLADYGATLGFDDAEGLSDPKRTDPDKRALLLAGNRRGVTVSLKEMSSDKTWHTRYVNAFCPRLFSAVRLPDPILSSRTIVIPLLRTTDRTRANSDPLDYSIWPYDRRKLIDDLWAVALTNLIELPNWDSWVGQHARLSGRALQPWRALLAVAGWLDSKGVTGLWQRIEALSWNYQVQRVDIETSDLTILVIRALCDCAISAINADSAINKETLTFSTSVIAEHAAQIAKDDESDIDHETITTRRVGRVLGKLRLKQPPRPGGRGVRHWSLALSDLRKLTLSYGIELSETLRDHSQDPLPVNGTDGIYGTNGTFPSDLMEGKI